VGIRAVPGRVVALQLRQPRPDVHNQPLLLAPFRPAASRTVAHHGQRAPQTVPTRSTAHGVSASLAQRASKARTSARLLTIISCTPWSSSGSQPHAGQGAASAGRSGWGTWPATARYADAVR